MGIQLMSDDQYLVDIKVCFPLNRYLALFLLCINLSVVSFTFHLSKSFALPVLLAVLVAAICKCKYTMHVLNTAYITNQEK